MIDQVERALKLGATSISIKKEGPTSRLIRYGMLAQPHRQFVIDKVKYPLQKAIENESRRLIAKTGAVCKDNPQYENSGSLIDLKDWFMEMEDNAGRAPLFESAFNLIIAKLEGIDFGARGFMAEQSVIVANKLLNIKVGKPTKLNTIHPHTHQLLDIRDWDMEDEKDGFFFAAWNILIYEVEHDPYYGFRFNRLLAKITERVFSGEWKFGDYTSTYGLKFNKILRRFVDMVNSGEWQFEPYKPADNFCWKEKL